MAIDEIEAFLEMLIAERGATQNTVVAYRQDLLDFVDFLKIPFNLFLIDLKIELNYQGNTTFRAILYKIHKD